MVLMSNKKWRSFSRSIWNKANILKSPTLEIKLPIIRLNSDYSFLFYPTNIKGENGWIVFVVKSFEKRFNSIHNMFLDYHNGETEFCEKQRESKHLIIYSLILFTFNYPIVINRCPYLILPVIIYSDKLSFYVINRIYYISFSREINLLNL